MNTRKLFRLTVNKERIFGLDILRAFAILFVAVEHGGNLLYGKWQARNNYFVFDGVTVFFVLSGFLIGGILIKSFEQKKTDGNLLTQFWIRRWFRTLPNYFLILFFLCIIHLCFDITFHLKDALPHFVFLQNFNYPMASFFPESWSLAIEEWFYLLTPFLLLFVVTVFKSSVKSAFLTTIIFVIVISFIIRYCKYLQLTETDNWRDIFRKEVTVRADSLMTGVFGAFCNFYYKRIFIKYKKILLFSGLLLFTASNYRLQKYFTGCLFYNCIFSYFITSLSVLLMLPFFNNIQSGKGIFFKIITGISLISYSVYLLNQSIFVEMLNHLTIEKYLHNPSLTGFVKYLLFWLLLIPCSILLYKYFELPCTQLREKFKRK